MALTAIEAKSARATDKLLMIEVNDLKNGSSYLIGGENNSQQPNAEHWLFRK
jgi:hypothetical protein